MFVPVVALAVVATPIVPLSSLWVPILIAGALAWVLSALFWTVSPHHKHEFSSLPNEDRVMAAMRDAGVKRGFYAFPYAGSQAAAKSPEFQKKLDDGPVGMLTVATAETVRNMGKPLVLSLVYYLVVSLFVGYLTGRTVAAGAEYLEVFRVAGTTAFLAYGMGIFQDTIWFARGWGRAWKHVFDALVIALVTAGVFGWRWPGM